MKRTLGYIKPYWIYIDLIALCSLGCSLANVFIVELLKQTVDISLSGDYNLPRSLLQIAGKAVIVVVLGMLSNYMAVRIMEGFGARFLRDMRRNLVNHIRQIAPDFMEKHNFGDIMERVSSDTNTIAGYMQTYFKDCVYAPMAVIVFAVYLFSMHPLLAVLCLGPLLVMVPLSIKLLKPVKLAQAEYVKQLGFTNNHIQAVFDGADVMKAYQLEGKLQKKYYNALKKTLDISHKNDLWQYNIEPLSALIGEAPRAIALCVGGYLVFQGEVSLGVLVAFLSGIDKIKEPFVYAYQLVIRTQMALVSVRRILEIMDMPVESREEVCLEVPQISPNVFRFEQVHFSYLDEADSNKSILENLDLEIEEGKRIALVGASGGGKSTIMKLMCRQYEVKSGEIYLYGNAFSKLEPETVRKYMALISQEAVLFPMSVRDNIRIGCPDANEQEIIQASQLAGCHDFIQNMTDGYDTLLEEHGSNLSGGQRQRITIARAILKNAPILLLDEPTSALDKETEQYINAALQNISVGKTVITIAHRLNTIVDYDEIIVLEAGKIVERGSHEALMTAKGRYYELFREFNQSGGAR